MMFVFNVGLHAGVQIESACRICLVDPEYSRSVRELGRNVLAECYPVFRFTFQKNQP